MRVTRTQGPLSVKAISGTRVVLMAFDLDPAELNGLHGFAIKRGVVGGAAPEFLTGIKYFPSLVPHPVKGAKYSTRVHPLQSFLWSDYSADPDTEYAITVMALYGTVGSLNEKHSVQFTIKTHKENEGGHGIWFNRGAIASQELARDFKNKKVVAAAVNQVDAEGKVVDAELRYLSRGLEEALMDYINGAKSGQGLRVCAYEFTYGPVLDALKRALDRGVDVQIVYHFTKKPNDANLKAIGKAGLTKTHGGKQILFQRTRTPIPHNKFIVKLVGGKAKAVWTGSTNFTDTGLFGQTNVGHLVTDDGVAKKYLDYWKELSLDPVHSKAVTNAVALTPNPPNAIAKSSIVEFYSPRIADNMLDWYGQRIDDTAFMAAMTIPFNVAPTLLKALGKTLDSVRVVILEDIPTKEVKDAEFQNKGRLVFSNGAILGKSMIKYKSGPGGARSRRSRSPTSTSGSRRRTGPRHEQGPRLLHARQGTPDRPAHGRSARLLRVGQLLHELAREQRRKHAAHPGRQTGCRHLPDGVRPDLPALLHPRRPEQVREQGRQEEPARARSLGRLDRAQLQARDLQEQPQADVLSDGGGDRRRRGDALEQEGGRGPGSLRRRGSARQGQEGEEEETEVGAQLSSLNPIRMVTWNSATLPSVIFPRVSTTSNQFMWRTVLPASFTAALIASAMLTADVPMISIFL